MGPREAGRLFAMTATLRVVLDQLTSPTDLDVAEAARQLSRALVAGAPRGCVLEAIVPADTPADILATAVPGLASVLRARNNRSALSGMLRRGLGHSLAGGMVHAPSLFAPLVRHDRVHSQDQTVVTVWDLTPWEHPESLDRHVASWERAMLARAVRFADAVVVPTHSMADRLGEIAPLGDRIRVVSGAASTGLRVPGNDGGRRAALSLPSEAVVLTAGPRESAALEVGLRAVAASAVDAPVIVLDAEEGHEPAISDMAAAAGIGEGRIHVRGWLPAADRAAVISSAVAVMAASTRSCFPWRVVDALALGVPVIVAHSAVHRDIIVDGGTILDTDTGADGGVEAMAHALTEALGSAEASARMRVQATDRGRAFSWSDAADRVWQLHADL